MSAAISPATAELRQWTDLRARAALLRVRLYRSDPADGRPVSFFSIAGDGVLMHPDLPALRARVEDLERGPT